MSLIALGDTMTEEYFELPLNMDRVCRICLTEATNLSPIFCIDQEVTDYSSLPQKIQVCGSIEIHEQDGLPSLICDVCVYKATVAHEFRQQCQISDTKLRMYYNKPPRNSIMECSTQTDIDSSLLSKEPVETEEHYFVKGELQVATNSAPEYTQADIEVQSETYVREEPSLTTEQIVMEDGKLYMCSIGFEGEKEMVKEDDCMEETAPVTEESIVGPASVDIDEQMDLEDKTDIEHSMHKYAEEECTDHQEEYLTESIVSEDMVEEEVVPQKRTSSRKAKSLVNKTYSEEEVDESYYDERIDNQGTEESKFQCKVCSKHCATLKGLKKHSLVHEKKHKCNVCLKMFYKQENLEFHKKIHSFKPHACQLCHTSFSKPQSLVRHLKSHTEKVNDMIKQINTDDPKDTNEPKKEMKLEDDTDDDTGGSNEVDEFENAPELYKCEVCNKYCSSLKNLKRHALVHGDKKYSCTVCKKWFFRPDTLKKHAEKHGHGLLDNLVDDNNLYDSDDDALPNPTTVPTEPESGKKDDSDEDATGEYKCQHCDKVMATKKGLRRHVSMHKPKKSEPVACEICRKVCASQARLLLHQRTHKPKEKVPREYLCHICSKVYPSNSSLTYHMRTHTGVKPHVCKICNSGFTTTTSLANHIRIHTGDKPFVCHVCSAAFAVSSAFRRHLTRHTGEANYLCKTCGKAFKRLSTLKEHTYTHSGEKPYVCKTCGAAYSHSGSLFAHQKRCRAQYGEMVVEDHTVTHIHVTNVQSAVRSLAVITPMF